MRKPSAHAQAHMMQNASVSGEMTRNSWLLWSHPSTRLETERRERPLLPHCPGRYDSSSVASSRSFLTLCPDPWPQSWAVFSDSPPRHFPPSRCPLQLLPFSGALLGLSKSNVSASAACAAVASPHPPHPPYPSSFPLEQMRHWMNHHRQRSQVMPHAFRGTR